MHKITKGLKKKKKGKKSKHKEDELFKPEELEAYRKEHQAHPTEEVAPAPGGQNEEWKKFLALTSGVDDILKKTQGDLDRIKSTSFFQRVPPPSEVQRHEEELRAEEEKEKREKEEQEQEEAAAEANLGIVQIVESESEEEDEDDIFDTGYIDAIAAGEVKLAYIPESPTKEEGDDPFDTSYAERAILGPAVERKGKKLVPLGAAVEVLTGRVQLPTCATQRPVSHRRQILKEKDLLLGSFDDNANSISAAEQATPEQVVKTLLDDDEIPIPDEPIDLSKTLHPIRTPVVEETKSVQSNLVAEFDVIKSSAAIEDEDDEEFAALAAESLSKPAKVITDLPVVPQPQTSVENWNAFEGTEPAVEEEEEKEVDPFDTTFADNLLPGKAELKIIENEVLNEDLDFNPRAEDKLATLLKTVPKDKLTTNTLEPAHKDLLGGSNTDLSQLGNDPLKPSLNDDYIEYRDPFDTSIVETAKQPGQTELKFLERELLGDIRVERTSVSDDEFDPRAGEPRERSVSRPEVLNVGKTVSFDIPSPTQTDLEHKVVKPLTPFYVRKNSVPEQVLSPEELEDPFDTSFVSKLAPGKAELKLIENELFDPNVERNLSISDQDFDPRDEKKVAIAKVQQTIEGIHDPTVVQEPKKEEPVDLLAVDNDIHAKVLTPAAETNNFEEISYVDPFDTSIASNILPGKTELKLLESELISAGPATVSSPDFNPRDIPVPQQPKVDLLAHSSDILAQKPLSPVSFDLDADDFDPFDTSIASNIQPGKTELKLIENELIN